MLFNETLKKFPELDGSNKYIVKDASIVKSKHFENGIIKILEGRENEMKMTEKVQCGRLKKVEDDDWILALKRMRIISLQLYYKNGGRGAEIQFTCIVSFCNRLRIYSSEFSVWHVISLQLYYKNGGRGAEIQFT